MVLSLNIYWNLVVDEGSLFVWLRNFFIIKK